MKTIFCFSLLIFLSINLKAQSIDYLNIRDTIVTFSCGKVDIEIVNKTKEELFNLDTSIISNNIYRYYKDISNCYYRIWGNSKDINDAYLAIDYNKKTINKNPDYSAAYWDIALIYYFLGECDIGDNYWELYKTKTNESEDDLDQIKQLKKLCDKKNQ